MADYSELKRLAEAATPGPWLSNSSGPGDDQDEEPMVYRSIPEAGEKAISVLFNADWATEQDSSFVAACRQEVPALIADLDRVSKRLCMCRDCGGQGEVYSGRDTYQGYNQPPEPEMDVCGTCNGDCVLGPIEDFEALAADRDQLKAEVARLTSDNASLRGSCAKLGAEHAGMVRTVRKQAAELDGLRKDAERYRWLRDKSEALHSFYLSVPIWMTGVKFSQETVDSTIDAISKADKP